MELLLSASLPHGGGQPSAWVRRWSHLVAPGASVLDVACGAGRHLRWFAGRGARVTGVDRDEAAVQPLRSLGRMVMADLEQGDWPLPGETFDAVIVTNYLWRPLFPALMASLADGGVLLYETFAVGQETIGKPSNPAFLLKPGELLALACGLHVVAYEDGFEAGGPRYVQRLAAVKTSGRDASVRRLNSLDCKEPS